MRCVISNRNYVAAVIIAETKFFRDPQRGIFLSPLRGFGFFMFLFLGLTPQAKYLSPLRGSRAGGGW
jgi:hypothetical protein